ncbi:MAG: ATP-binding cassette domain-containing protein [Deltaproteobacteria bacterium]|nr:MAG: ATP-binding cassette domain-containing protein [Deltaproteobacteria bacterium]
MLRLGLSERQPAHSMGLVEPALLFNLHLSVLPLVFSFFGGSKARLERVCQIFPELKDRLRSPAGILSGGQQRMVTLGRGLMSAPRLLMLDEPFMGLSPKLVQRFCDSFRDLRQAGVTLLISGQLMQRVLNVAEKAFILERGRSTFAGTGPLLLKDPHLQEIILPV